MAQSELDAHYDPSRPLADGEVATYFAAFDAASARARDELACTGDVRYGPHERETLDYFPAHGPGAPLFVWVHGGYWRRLSKDAFSFVARPIVAAGGAVAVLNYPLAPEASLDEIVAAVRRGYARALTCAGAARAYVGGHSVGAQLAATIAARYDVRGMLALSGLYDLEPLRRTYVNDWIALDAASAARNGPLHLPPLGRPPLVVAVGGREQAAFAEQQRRYVAAWRAWGGEAREIDAATHDHFSIVLELADATSPLARALVRLVGLAP